MKQGIKGLFVGVILMILVIAVMATIAAIFNYHRDGNDQAAFQAVVTFIWQCGFTGMWLVDAIRDIKG